MATMLVVAAIALTVTPIFVVNAFRLLATDTFVRHEIDRGGFPPDRYGLTTTERRRLALTGLHSILPGGEGIALLERATLPDGSSAFDSRELRHMSGRPQPAGCGVHGATRRPRRHPRPRDRAPSLAPLALRRPVGAAARLRAHARHRSACRAGDPARLRRVLPALPRGLLQRRHLALLGHRHVAAYLPGDVLGGHGEAGGRDRRRPGGRGRPRGLVVGPPDPPRRPVSPAPAVAS